MTQPQALIVDQQYLIIFRIIMLIFKSYNNSITTEITYLRHLECNLIKITLRIVVQENLYPTLAAR